MNALIMLPQGPHVPLQRKGAPAFICSSVAPSLVCPMGAPDSVWPLVTMFHMVYGLWDHLFRLSPGCPPDLICELGTLFCPLSALLIPSVPVPWGPS